MIHRITITTIALLSLLSAPSMYARPLQDTAEVLTELALAMMLMGDVSAFSDDAYRSDSSAHLGFKLKPIVFPKPTDDTTRLEVYSGHIVGSSLWYTGERRRKNGIFNLTHHDMWSAPIIDFDSMHIGLASTAFFDSLGVNTPKHEGYFTISGSMFVYTGCDYDMSLGSCDLLICNLADARPVLWYLPKTVNTKNWESQPSIDDDLTLFFASNAMLEDTVMGLYYAVYDSVDKSFRQSVRLPRHVNLTAACGAPFVIPGTSLLIYWASNGSTSKPIADFWCTQYTRNNNGELVFSKPKRLPPSLRNGGKPISFSYDRVSRTIIVGLENNDVIEMSYVRLPESM